MASERFAYVWEYRIDPNCRSQFLAAYRPDGEWARLFSKDSSYLGTKLLQDVADEDRFSTIDFWVSEAARDAFRERYAAEFDELDRRCEDFTRQERLVGDYVEIG